MYRSVTVVVPALNEVETIAGVVATMRRSPLVGEVIVVDNCSHDETGAVAALAGATVIRCEKLGMGAAMKAGIAQASFDAILKTDGDIRTPDERWVESLTSYLCDDCWFCSGEYESDDDEFPMNILVASPPLRIFFPELSAIRLPLSGTYAFDRRLLDWRSLPDNSAFDVGLLISAFLSGNRARQRTIGLLNDRRRRVAEYAGMAEEVLAEILRHAALSGRLEAFLECVTPMAGRPDSHR